MVPRANWIPAHALTYSPVSTHTSFEDAKLALHSYDTFVYVTAYNYGAHGSGKVYRCISHEECALRLRIVETTQDEEEIPVIFQLAVAGEHGTQRSNKKRKGIDPSVKGEVDRLLATGVHPKKCRLTLQKKYADQPEILAKLPDERKLKNRLLTLRKHGWKVAEAGLASDTEAGLTPPPVRRSSRKRCEKVETLDESSDEEGGNSESEYEEGTPSERHELAEFDIERTFDKEKMMEEFTALPGRPVFWNILKKTRYIEDESEDIVTQWITGQVIGWQTSENTLTKWMVRFTDGEKSELTLEELVNEIKAAAQLGLNVMGQPHRF